MATDSLKIDCPVLVTERLVLRAPHEDDVASFAVLANNPRVAEMTARLPHPYSEEEARAFIAACAERRDGCTYAVTLADNGATIGVASLEDGVEGPRIGYWLGEPYWSRGYASEAAAALVELAFRATAVETLHAACRTVNPASRHVLVKCGFRPIDFDTMQSVAAGEIEIERFAISRAQWLNHIAGQMMASTRVS